VHACRKEIDGLTHEATYTADDPTGGVALCFRLVELRMAIARLTKNCVDEHDVFAAKQLLFGAHVVRCAVQRHEIRGGAFAVVALHAETRGRNLCGARRTLNRNTVASNNVQWTQEVGGGGGGGGGQRKKN